MNEMYFSFGSLADKFSEQCEEQGYKLNIATMIMMTKNTIAQIIWNVRNVHIITQIQIRRVIDITIDDWVSCDDRLPYAYLSTNKGTKRRWFQ